MSFPAIDKVTALNVLSVLVVAAYVLYMMLYPTTAVPAGLERLANLVIGYLFTITGITVGQKLTKSQ